MEKNCQHGIWKIIFHSIPYHALPLIRSKAAFTRGTFSYENRHFAFFLSQLLLFLFFLHLRKKKGKMPILAAKSRMCERSLREKVFCFTKKITFTTGSSKYKLPHLELAAKNTIPITHVLFRLCKIHKR